MKDRVFNYKYYILHKFSSFCYGVLDECLGRITYHELVLDKIFDQFTNTDKLTIMCHPDIGEKEMLSHQLLYDIEEGKYEITKEYRQAWSHISGIPLKAVAQSTEFA